VARFWFGEPTLQAAAAAGGAGDIHLNEPRAFRRWRHYRFGVFSTACWVL